jgi:tetratricopeptide (TPR) repeat protein
VLVPLLVLTVIEITLRLAGYGYPTSLFKRIRIGDTEALVENDKFGLRFFPPELSRSPPPVVMEAKKPPGTYRIFILGESAALGDPRPAYGAGRYLQALLQARCPGTRFEVVCVAMTAINSHVLVPIARECARHEGDCWIVYMGNNEMIGPFGAATVFGPQTPPLSYIRLTLALQRTRLGQLLVSAGRRWRHQGSEAARWAGMEMFLKNQVAPGEPRKEAVYGNFETNLRDILQIGLGAGVRVVLSTVAVNLKDCPPFGSADPGQTPDRAAWDKLCADGATAASGGDWTQAAGRYQQAAKQAPESAQTQFRWAEALLHLGDSAGARQHFEQARDLDTLPFRTDSRLNQTMSEVARQFSSRAGFAWFDAVSLFSQVSPVGIPGAESFYEHVHFNFDGNYRLGRAWAEQVFGLLPAAMRSQAAGEWATQEVCEQRLGLSDWNRASVLEDLIRRLGQAPFTSQLNHAATLERFQGQLRELRQHMDKAAAAKARTEYQAAINLAPKDHRLRENFAEFLEETGDLKEAAAQWEQVCKLIPQHHLGYFEAGRLLARLGRADDAQARLQQAVALRPELSEGWLELGKLHASQNRLELALTEYERARALLPQDPRVHYHIGLALSKLGRRLPAIQALKEAVRLRPGYWDARYALGEELAFDDRTAEARAQFEEVIRLKPDHVMAHLNLGVAMGKQGQWPEALKELEEAARLDPQNKLAAEYVAKLRAQLEPKQ